MTHSNNAAQQRLNQLQIWAKEGFRILPANWVGQDYVTDPEGLIEEIVAVTTYDNNYNPDIISVVVNGKLYSSSATVKATMERF
jgi:hypothetical protein